MHDVIKRHSYEVLDLFIVKFDGLSQYLFMVDNLRPKKISEQVEQFTPKLPDFIFNRRLFLNDVSLLPSFVIYN